LTNGRIYCQKYGTDLLVIKIQAEYNFIQPYATAIIGSYGHANIGYYNNNTTPRKLKLIKFDLVGLFQQCHHSLQMEYKHRVLQDLGGVQINRIFFIQIIFLIFKHVELLILKELVYVWMIDSVGKHFHSFVKK
jgi:hypothetical protein